MTGRSGRHWSDAEKRQLAKHLRAATFSDDEVGPWLAALTYVSVSSQVANAKQWRNKGFPAHVAVQWEEVAFDPRDALLWAGAGFKPLEAEYVRSQIIQQQVDGDVIAMLHTEDDWRSSGIPPLWVCRLLGAGVRTIQEGMDWYRRSHTDPTVHGRLRMMAGLAGWDFAYLELSDTA